MSRVALSARCISVNGSPNPFLAGVVLVFVVSLAGCGSIPDAQLSYYQAKSQVTFKVTRTVGCDAKNLPIVANTVTPNVTHTADLTKKPVLVNLAGLRGTFTDSDIKFDFYEDGRLKGVNASQTGQGEAILKVATTLATTLGAFGASEAKSPFADECAYVKAVGGGKPLTLTYEGIVDPSKTTQQTIPPDAASAFYADKLKSAIGDICVVTQDTEKPLQPVQYKVNDGDVLITARQPGLLKVEVGTPTPGNGCSATLWQGRVPVAQLGTDYNLPIPRAAILGKMTFGAAFAESGALTSVQYVSNSGASAALGSVNSIATIAQGETTSAKIAEVKAEADLIVQQQRLIECRAAPASCK